MTISENGIGGPSAAPPVADGATEGLTRLHIDEQLARQHARTVMLLSEMAAARVEARRSARRSR